MGKHKPAKKKPSAKAKSAHKPVKKAAPRPTKNKARKHTVEKNHSKPSQPHKGAAKPAKPAHATEAKTPSPAKAKGKSSDTAAEPANARLTPDELRKQLVAKARSRTKTQRAAAFTLDDVRGEIAKAGTVRGDSTKAARKSDEAGAKSAAAAKKVAVEKSEQRRFGAASLADILGYNPTKDERPTDDESQIDPKFLRYYKLLVQLRNHVTNGLAMHAEETLKRSNREDSGDLSGYGQHMADAGTDNFDRDFALSLVSNEQEALYEIEEAIKRIKNGTYGICENTGKPISKDRLLAVPFARFSVESQAEFEKVNRRSSSRGGVFAEAGTEEGAKLVEEESE